MQGTSYFDWLVTDTTPLLTCLHWKQNGKLDVRLVIVKKREMLFIVHMLGNATCRNFNYTFLMTGV